MLNKSKSYTAVVYFHGIGNPRRHVSLSQFLDYFDRFGQAQDKSGIGRPRDFEYGAEQFSEDDLVHFVEFKRVVTVRDRPNIAKTIRVYEGYWVPEAGSRSNLLYIFVWLLRRILNPMLVAFSRWRAFPGLRLASLHRLAGIRFSQARAQRLERLYRDFENWENREEYPRGTFREFRKFIKNKSPRDEQSAELWRSTFAKYNLTMNFYFLVVLGCAVVSIMVLSRSIMIVAASLFLASYPIGVSFWSHFLIAAAGLALLVYLYTQGDNYVFDVVSWTAQSERGERYAARDRVTRYAQRLLRHVISDPNCTQCVIVGHSLGTSIATEALLREGLLATARGTEEGTAAGDALRKVGHVFSIGSPIDRIFYLFQTDSSFSHRYSRLFEEQRLSIELPPFSYPSQKSDTKLINFWSRFDPISSSIISLRKNVSDRKDAIQNIESFPPGIPLPIASHTTYFADPVVMRSIYWAVMAGRLPKYKGPDDDESFPKYFNRSAIVFSLLMATTTMWLVTFWIYPLPATISLIVWFGWLDQRRRAILRARVRSYGNFLRR